MVLIPRCDLEFDKHLKHAGTGFQKALRFEFPYTPTFSHAFQSCGEKTGSGSVDWNLGFVFFLDLKLKLELKWMFVDAAPGHYLVFVHF